MTQHDLIIKMEALTRLITNDNSDSDLLSVIREEELITKEDIRKFDKFVYGEVYDALQDVVLVDKNITFYMACDKLSDTLLPCAMSDITENRSILSPIVVIAKDKHALILLRPSNITTPRNIIETLILIYGKELENGSI